MPIDDANRKKMTKKVTEITDWTPLNGKTVLINTSMDGKRVFAQSLSDNEIHEIIPKKIITLNDGRNIDVDDAITVLNRALLAHLKHKDTVVKEIKELRLALLDIHDVCKKGHS